LTSQVPGFRIFGINEEVSTWDLFVLWHFLPWHRMFLIRLEEQLQRVTNDAETALPYWDWAAGGELPGDEQP